MVRIFWNQQVRTDRIIPNNKLDTVIRDNKQGTRMLTDAAIPGDRNVIKKEAEKILKYKDLRNSGHVKCVNKSGTGNNMGNWNHFKITQTISERHTRKTPN